MSLIRATQQDDVNEVRQLLATGEVDVYEIDDYGWSALIYASRYGYEEIVEILLEHGKSSKHINQVDKYGWTALTHASENGHKGVVEIFLNHDNSSEHINRQDNLRWTALIHASHEGHKEIVELLLEHDANVDVLDYEDKSAIDLAKTEEIKELLLNWEPEGVRRAKGCE